MKNTIRTFNLKMPDGSCRDGREYINLRRNGERLTVVGRAKEIGEKNAGDRLLGDDLRSSRRYFFVQRNHRQVVVIGYSDADGNFTSCEQLLFESNSEVEMTVAGDFVVFGGGDTLTYAWYNGDGYSYLGAMPEVPTVTFGTSTVIPLSTPHKNVTLTQTYNHWSEGLCRKDEQMVMSQWDDAVKQLRAQAATAGLCLQRIKLRLALRLYDDSLLWGETQQPSGNDNMLQAEVKADGSLLTEGFSINAMAWRPTMRLISPGIGQWASLVKAIEVWAAGYDDEQRYVDIQTTESTANPSLKYITIKERGSGDEEKLRKLAEASSWRQVAVITDIDGFRQGIISGEGILPTGDGTVAIKVIPGGEIAVPQLPLHVGAKVMAEAGGKLLVGDIVSHMPLPPYYLSLVDPDDLCDGVASTFVTIDYATPQGISRTVRAEVGEHYAMRLSPMIVVADSRARCLTVTIIASGERRRVSIPLTPSADGAYAYAVNVDGFLLTITTDTSIPQAIMPTIELPHMLCCATISNPLLLQSLDVRVPDVNAIAPTMRYGSSWLLGRSPACVFSSDGMRLLSFDNKGHCTAATLISRHTVDSPRNLTVTSRGLTFIDRGNRFCRYEGSKVKATSLKVSNAIGLAWSTTWQETWVICHDECLVVADDGSIYRRTQKFDGCTSSLLTDAIGIYTIDREEPSIMMIKIVSPPLLSAGRRLCGVLWHFNDKDVDLQLRVYAIDCHESEGKELASAKISGEIAPIILQRVASPRVRAYRLFVQGYMSSESSVCSPEVAMV